MLFWKFFGRVLASAFVVLLCIGNYHNSLRNEFAFDDYLAIVNNRDVMYGSNGTDHVSEYAKLWKNDIWGKDMKAVDSHRSYRPLLVTVFKLIVQLYGLNPWIFRAVSIFLHSVASIGVFYLSTLIFKSDSLAFGTALLFASHPVHIESVAAVVNMAEAVSLIFSIAAFCIFYQSSEIISRDTSEDSYLSVKKAISIIVQLLLIAVWFGFLSLSLLFKETGITVCGIIVASSGTALLHTIKAAYLVDRGKSLSVKMNGEKSKGLLRTAVSATLRWSFKNVLWLLAALGGVFLYSVFRVILLVPDNPDQLNLLANLLRYLNINNWGELRSKMATSYLGESRLLRKAENPFSFLKGQEKILSMMYLHFRYFYQLLWPENLCAEYAFDCIPKVSSLQDPRALLTIGFYVLLVSSFFYFLWWVAVPTKEELKNVKKESLSAVVESDNEIKLKAGQEPVKDKSVRSVAWTTTYEHYLLSLVWMIVPFIPASGENILPFCPCLSVSVFLSLSFCPCFSVPVFLSLYFCLFFPLLIDALLLSLPCSQPSSPSLAA